MPFCGKCGQKLEDGVNFCSSCGTPVAPAEQPPQSQPNPTPTQSYTSVEDSFRQLTQTNDKTGEFDPMDIKNNKAMAIFAYLGILVLIPLFAVKNSKFVRFHVNQGFTLFILSAAYSIVTGVIRSILRWVAWPLYRIAGALFPLLGLAFAVLAIIGIVNVANGKAKELPVIGKLHILQ